MEYSLGHKIYFMCIADGDPRPEIYWYKDGIEIYAHQHLIVRIIIPNFPKFYSCDMFFFFFGFRSTNGELELKS